jgi:hypothetical protein
MREETVLEREERAKAFPTPHRAGQGPAACGELKPLSVMNHALDDHPSSDVA